MESVTIMMLIAANNIIGNRLAEQFNGLSDQIKEWRRRLTPQEKKKWAEICDLAHQHLNYDPEQKDTPILSFNINESPGKYSIGTGELHVFQLGVMIERMKEMREKLNAQQPRGWLGLLGLGSASKRPETFLLEQHMEWLSKLSHLHSQDFNEALIEKIIKRKNYLKGLLEVSGMNEEYKILLKELLIQVQSILAYTKRKVRNYKCRNLLDNVKIEGSKFVQVAIKFIMEFGIGSENKELYARIANHTSNNLFLNEEKKLLENNFYGKLILLIITQEAYKNIHHIDHTSTSSMYAFEENDSSNLSEKEKAFMSFTRTLNWFINFFSICSIYREINNIGGSFFAEKIIQIGDVGNISTLFNKIRDQFTKNLQEIQNCYESEIESLQENLDDLEKRSKKRCNCANIEKEKQQIIKEKQSMQVVLAQLEVKKDTLLEHLSNCSEKISNLVSFDMRTLIKEEFHYIENQAHSLLMARKKLCDNGVTILGIEYPPTITDVSLLTNDDEKSATFTHAEIKAEQLTNNQIRQRHVRKGSVATIGLFGDLPTDSSVSPLLPRRLSS